MIAKNIDTIIFDFGGVLINIDYHRTIAAFKDLGIEDFETKYSQANQSTLFSDIETGKISAQRFINELLAFSPQGTSPNAVVRAWNAMILEVQQSTVDVLLSLKDSYRIFLLSNTNEIHFPKAMMEWKKTTSVQFYDCFEHVYLSHEIGMRKPDENIFNFVCESQNINPENALFIDDSIQHIDGAKKIGLNTLHLTSEIPLKSVFS